jgi:hypothetical protein
MKDMVRSEETLNYLYLDKISALSDQNFLLTESAESIPLYQPYVVGNSLFKLNYSGNGYDTIYVRYYGKEIPMPKPSFSMSRKGVSGGSDSLWILPFRNGITYQLNYEAFIIFNSTNVADGSSTFRFGSGFRGQDVDI